MATQLQLTVKNTQLLWKAEKLLLTVNYMTSTLKKVLKLTAADSGEGTPVKAALPGNVLKVLVSEGDSIAEGDIIAVVEAMKMETEIKSPVGGTVKSVEIEVGNKVQTGQVLVTIG